MDKIKTQEEIKKLEFAILETEMKDNLDNADRSLIEYYQNEIQKLKNGADYQ